MTTAATITATTAKDIEQCAKGVACATLSMAVGEKFVPDAYFGKLRYVLGPGVAMGAGFVCDEAEEALARSLHDKKLDQVMNESKQAQPCFNSTLNSLVSGCVSSFMDKLEQKYAAAKLELGPALKLQMQAKYQANCYGGTVENYHVNYTIASKVYAKCGFPGLAARLKNLDNWNGDETSTKRICGYIASGLMMTRQAYHMYKKWRAKANAEEDEATTEEEEAGEKLKEIEHIEDKVIDEPWEPEHDGGDGGDSDDGVDDGEGGSEPSYGTVIGDLADA